MSTYSTYFPKATTPYKVYTALLTQTDTGAPIPTVLENTLGEITYSRPDNLSYNVISSGLFIAGKTFIIFNSLIATSEGQGGINGFTVDRLNINTIELRGGGDNDNILKGTPIEIRVYP